MRHSTLLVLFAIIAFIVSTVFSLEVEEFGRGNLRVSNDRLLVVVEGNQNVPRFSISRFSRGSPSTSYRVRFQHLYQSTGITNTQRLPATQIALPSLRWSFNDWRIVDDILHFTITGTGRGDFDSVQFFVRVPERGSDFKFDVRLNGFNGRYWRANSGALVLGWKIDQMNNINSDKFNDVTHFETDEDNRRYRIRFGRRGYMEVDKEAFLVGDSDRENPYQVRVFALNGMIYNTYQRFSGSLHHDPIIGYRDEDNEGFDSSIEEDPIGPISAAPKTSAAGMALLGALSVAALLIAF